MGSRLECLRQGIFVGKRESEAENVLRQRGASGRARGEGREQGRQQERERLRIGTGMTRAQLNGLSKDTLRDIVGNRKRDGLSQVGAIGRLSKDQLKQILIDELNL